MSDACFSHSAVTALSEAGNDKLTSCSCWFFPGFVDYWTFLTRSQIAWFLTSLCVVSVRRWMARLCFFACCAFGCACGPGEAYKLQPCRGNLELLWQGSRGNGTVLTDIREVLSSAAIGVDVAVTGRQSIADSARPWLVSSAVVVSTKHAGNGAFGVDYAEHAADTAS